MNTDNPTGNTELTWYVYMVCCADTSLYTGITRHPARRLAQHNTGPAGARYTRAHRPVGLVYCEALDSRSAAARREHAIKRLPRSAKLHLVLANLSTSARLCPPATLCADSLHRLHPHQ